MNEYYLNLSEKELKLLKTWATMAIDDYPDEAEKWLELALQQKINELANTNPNDIEEEVSK